MLIITGTLAWDYLMEFPGKFGDHILPEHTNNVNVSFIVDRFAKRRGGTAGNVSYTLGLLKTPHMLFSFAGSDFAEYKNAFNNIGIDTSYVQIDSTEHTATGFAMTDKSNNQIWGYYYGAAKNNPTLQIKKVAHKKDLVLIGPQGAEGSMSLVKQCIALGIPYFFDPGFILTQVTNKDLTLGVKNAACLIGNEYEMELMKTRVANWQKNIQDKIVITTLSEKGAIIIDKGNRYAIKPIPNNGVVSTAGAGDSWRSGFLAGLYRGYDLQTCGHMGAIAAVYTVEHFGTQEHMFTIKQFEKRYRQAFGSLIKL